MKRKLIKQGAGVLTMTIPKKWVSGHQLAAGDEVDVVEKDNTLILSTDKVDKLPEVSLDLKHFGERTIRNVLNQVYRKGFDRITFTYDDIRQLEIIEELTRRTLIGFEVVDKDKKKVIIENIAEPTADKYPIILRKLFLMIQLEIEEIGIDIKNNSCNSEKRKDVKEVVDSYTNLVRRLIIKYEIEGKNSYLLYYAASLLSLIHHAYFYLHTFIDKKKKKLHPETVILLEQSMEIFKLYYDAFYKKDFGLAYDLTVKREKLSSLIEEKLQQQKGIDNVALYYIGDATRLIQMSSTVIFGLATPV